jgi:hypothetical protein
MKKIKTILSVLAFAVLTLALVSGGAGAAEFEGDGTPESPLRIGTVEQLLAFGARVTGGEINLCAELTANLTVDDWTAIGKAGTYPIDESPAPYAGVFDGQRHELTLSNSNDTGSCIALFHTVGPTGVVRNLRLNVNFKGRQYIAGVAARNYGTIERVTVDGVINANIYAGGIAALSAQKAVEGVMTGGKILHCLNRAEINGNNNNVAGVVGSFMGEMRYCGNAGTVTSEGFIGGLLMMGSTSGQSLFIVSDCYNAGKVINEDDTSLLNSSFAGLLGGTNNYIKNWTTGYKISNVFSYGMIDGVNELNKGYNTVIAGILDGNFSDLHVATYYANTYYLDSLTGRLFGNGGIGDGSSVLGKPVIMAKSAEVFASADMADLLNNGRTGTGAPWEYIEDAPYPTIKLVGDKAALEAAIAEAAIESLNEEDYTSSSWAALTSALATAETLAEGEFVKQDEIDAALDALSGAFDALAELADKTGLASAIAEAETLAKSGYTAASWATLASALTEAKTVAAETDAAQETVDAALANLAAALESLVRYTGGGNVVEVLNDNVNFVETTGTETVEVLLTQIENAIERVTELTDTAEASGSPVRTIEIEAPEKTGVKAVEVVISVESLSAVAGSTTVENLKITSAVGELTLDTTTIGKVVTDAGDAEEVCIGIESKGTGTEAASDGSLTEQQKAAVSDDEKVRAVYDASIIVGGEKLKNFETAGKLTIGLPYTLRPGEVAKGVGAEYIADNGSAEQMKGVNYARSLAVFDTTHLSLYAVTYDETASGGSVASGSGSGCDAGTGALALALLAGALAARAAKGKK